MATNWRTSEVVCPFYRDGGDKLAGDPRRIGCEGITDQSRITLDFNTAAAAEQQRRIFCCGRYGSCEIFRAVCGAKYPEEAAFHGCARL